ncbi:MAG: hypothetical protein V2B15_01275 [Bacteroidota bacterium]
MKFENNKEGSKPDWLKAGNGLLKKSLLSKIDDLSKKRTIGGSTKSFFIYLPISILVVFLCFVWIKTGFGIRDISNMEPGETRGWVKLSNYLLPLLQWGFLILGVIMFFASLYMGLTALRAKASSTITVKCPGCSKTFEFSRIYMKNFKFVCPDCLSFVRAKASIYSNKNNCNYCDYTFYNGANEKFKCPSCGKREGSSEQKCAKCGTKIPKGVLFCNSCFAWIAPQENGNMTGLGADPVLYNVELFSGKTCKAYLDNLIPRIKDWSDRFAGITKDMNHDNMKGVNLYDMKGLFNSFKELYHLVAKSNAAIEMLYLRNLQPDTAGQLELKDKVYQLIQSLEQMNKYGNLREKDYKSYSDYLKHSLEFLS